MPLDERRKVAEAICEKIVIGQEGKDRKISITYSGRPSSEELCKNLTSLWAARVSYTQAHDEKTKSQRIKCPRKGGRQSGPLGGKPDVMQIKNHAYKKTTEADE